MNRVSLSKLAICSLVLSLASTLRDGSKAFGAPSSLKALRNRDSDSFSPSLYLRKDLARILGCVTERFTSDEISGKIRTAVWRIWSLGLMLSRKKFETPVRYRMIGQRRLIMDLNLLNARTT